MFRYEEDEYYAISLRNGWRRWMSRAPPINPLFIYLFFI